MSHPKSKPQLSTFLVRGDDDPTQGPVAPSISVSSTFRHNPDIPLIGHWDPLNPSTHIYSRYTQDVNMRAEKIIGGLYGDGLALTYASGLAASYAALVHCKPKRIAVTGGYFGCHETMNIYSKAAQTDIPKVPLDSEYREGDICWLETPVNPTGTSRDIAHYAKKIHKVGGLLVVDATFGPPPLQDPFKWGADIVLHSATKYLGGHSDMLGGAIIVKSPDTWRTLWTARTYTGSNMGSLESWLLLRSLRTLKLRVLQQSKTATEIVGWLNSVAHTPAGQSFEGAPGGVLKEVVHASLQTDEKFIQEQLEGGYPATFSIYLVNETLAAKLPFLLHYFTPATSLGGVESLIEQRSRADGVTDPRLLRISIGLEEFEDLKLDLTEAFVELHKLLQLDSKVHAEDDLNSVVL